MTVSNHGSRNCCSVLQQEIKSMYVLRMTLALCAETCSDVVFCRQLRLLLMENSVMETDLCSELLLTKLFYIIT